MQKLTILGSTGSIGLSTLDVVRRRRERYCIHALVAGWNANELANQIQEFRPQVAVVATKQAQADLIGRLEESALPRREWPELAFGAEARVEAAKAPEVDFVMSAIVGVRSEEHTSELQSH